MKTKFKNDEILCFDKINILNIEFHSYLFVDNVLRNNIRNNTYYDSFFELENILHSELK